VGVASAGIGFGSDIGLEYEETGSTAVSDGGATHDYQAINAASGTGQWTGKEGVGKNGKWSLDCKVKAKSNDDTVIATAESTAVATFYIPSNPSYE